MRYAVAVVFILFSFLSLPIAKLSANFISQVEDTNDLINKYANLHNFPELLELSVNKSISPLDLPIVRAPASRHNILSQPERCSEKSGRNYLQEKILGIKAIDSSFLQTRKESASNISRKCVVYAQRSVHRKAEQTPSNSYANCASETAQPTRGTKKPCVTEEYANAIHNAFVEVMNCFGMNQKLYFPQVVFESSFHLNAIAHNDFDSGVVQYTQTGIRHIIESPLTKKIFNGLYQSGNPACNKIAQFVRQDLTAADAKVKTRCGFIAPPHNPVQSFVFFAVHHLRDEVLLESALEQRKLFDQMIELGWVDDFNDEINIERKKKLIRALSILSYNAGVEKTIRMLTDYLKNRAIISKTENRPLSDSDFDFTLDTSVLRSALRKVTLKKFQEFYKNVKIKQFSFPEYVLIYHSGYMHELRNYTLSYESKFESGCTSSVELKL